MIRFPIALSFVLTCAACVPAVATDALNPAFAALHHERHSEAKVSAAAPEAQSEADELATLAPDADPHVLELALAAMHCAQSHGVSPKASRLAVIDFSRASLKRQLWVFDRARHKLLYEDLVAHGSGSGGNFATHFSNVSGSHASSLGLFVTREAYIGHNGYSLRLDGLEPGFNDAALARAIVIHGAKYVSESGGRTMGRLGRSWGCPALRPAVTRPIIDALKNAQFVFAYYPEKAWLVRSALLICAAARADRPATSKRVDIPRDLDR